MDRSSHGIGKTSLDASTWNALMYAKEHPHHHIYCLEMSG